jgi:hypothetical protein
LPTEAFVFGEWKAARVNIDDHVEADHHYYSVPHSLVHERVELRIGAATVEIFHKGQRISSHARSFARGRYTTCGRSHAQGPPGPARVVADSSDSLGGQTLRPIPFRNMIYLGDGPTDVPCMSLIQQHGGYVVGVAAPGDRGIRKAHELSLGRRNNTQLDANFVKGGRAFGILEQSVHHIASRTCDDVERSHGR